jgi:hypothetical protein
MYSSIISSLRDFPDQLERLYAAIPAPCTGWTPPSWEGIPSETFTAIDQLCHIRDIEIDGYHLRFERLLNEDAPSLVSIDSYEVARERAYPDAPAAQIFADFRKARAHTVALLETLGAEQWQRAGSFQGYGPVTVQGLAHYLCSHDQQHLAGMHWLLGAYAANGGAQAQG